MQTLVDALDHYQMNCAGAVDKTMYTTAEGIVAFYADDDHLFDGQNVIVYYIDIRPTLRHQGRCSRLVKELMRRCPRAAIVAIGNPSLATFLERCGWKVHGADREWVRADHH